MADPAWRHGRKGPAPVGGRNRKVALDIPAPATGVLREVLVQEGTTVPVGTVLARLEHEPVETVMSRVGGVGYVLAARLQREHRTIILRR